MAKKSDSIEQRELETVVLLRAIDLGHLPSGELVQHLEVEINAGRRLDIDGAIRAGDGTVVAVMEVFSTMGDLKPGQKNKLKGDILKLAAFIDADTAKYIVTTSEAAHAWLTGTGWCAEAARRLGVTVAPPVPLTEDERARLERARTRQKAGISGNMP